MLKRIIMIILTTTLINLVINSSSDIVIKLLTMAMALNEENEPSKCKASGIEFFEKWRLENRGITWRPRDYIEKKFQVGWKSPNCREGMQKNHDSNDLDNSHKDNTDNHHNDNHGDEDNGDNNSKSDIHNHSDNGNTIVIIAIFPTK